MFLYSKIRQIIVQMRLILYNQILTLKVCSIKIMTLGNNINNIKTLVFLIPNEGHHQEGEENESRFLDQHFVPDNVAINTGTTVLWFNGDVSHERTVDVKDAQ